MCFSILINHDPSKLGEQSEAGINRKNVMCKEVFQPEIAYILQEMYYLIH